MKQYRSEKAGRNIIRTYDELVRKWSVQTEEFYLETSFGSTHVIAAGEKELPPLFLFHGVGDDSALMWVYNAKSLAEHFRIYCFDIIGGPGKSTMGSGYNKTYDDVSWFEEIMKHLKIKKTAMAGVSHGGYLVQLFALKRPQMVEKAISISGAVPCGEDKSPMKTMMKIFFPEALFPTKNNTVKLMKKLAGDNVKVFTENPLIMEHYQWLLKGFNNMAMRFHKVTTFTEEEIASIRDKVFYLVGEEDPFEQLGGKEAILNHRMNAQFYPHAGHGLNHECAEEINQRIIEILEDKVHM